MLFIFNMLEYVDIETIDIIDIALELCLNNDK